MAKIKNLLEVLMENQGFNPGWKPLENELPNGKRVITGIENPRFSKVEMVVVCRDDGTPLFDQYQI